MEGVTAPSALRDKYGGQVRCVTNMVGHCARDSARLSDTRTTEMTISQTH